MRRSFWIGLTCVTSLLMACKVPCEAGFVQERGACVRQRDAASDESAERDAGRPRTDGEPGQNDLDAATPCAEDTCNGCADLAESALLGTPCSDGEGDCNRAGVWECDRDLTIVCSAVPRLPQTEACGGGDEDCDGEVDETSENDSALGSELWYQDCDGDGYAVRDASPVSRCKKPGADETQCASAAGGWTTTSPFAAADCMDQEARAFPGQTAYFMTPRIDDATSFDFDCDGQSVPDLAPAGLVINRTGDCETYSHLLMWLFTTDEDPDCIEARYPTLLATMCGRRVKTMQEITPYASLPPCVFYPSMMCNYAKNVDLPCR